MRKLIILLTLAAIPLCSNAQWVQLTSPTSEILYGVHFVNDLTGFAAGNLNGAVLKTVDGGLSWNSIATGGSGTFYDLYFSNEQTGYAAGTSRQILMTQNSGATWVMRSSGAGTIYELEVPTAVGYAVGSDPTIVDKTVYYGINWTPLTPPTAEPLRGCNFVSPAIGWICGYNGTIIRTTDGAANWIPQTQAASMNFECVRFYGSAAGYAAGQGGVMVRTVNSGQTWTTVNTGTTGTLYDIFLVNSISGWVVGENGIILKTSDAGLNWTAQQCPVTSTLHSVYMATPLTGYIVGAGGVVLKTTTGGGIPAGIIGNELPANFELRQNYPNPFNPVTNIEYTIQKTAAVRLSVYNLAGELAEVLVNGVQSPGSYKVVFDGSGFSSGVYMYVLEVDGFRDTKRMVLVK